MKSTVGVSQTSEEQQQKAFEQDIIECCREMADVYLEIQREFEPLDAEVSRAYLDAEPRSGRPGL